MEFSVRSRRSIFQTFVLVANLGATAVAGAQGPWNVTLTPTLNPLPIGSCAAIWLKAIDPAKKDRARNPLGDYITIADFDIAVTSADARSVALKEVDASHRLSCACQGAGIGTAATITATYPARALPEARRVPGVSFQKTAAFALARKQGAFNPPECTGAVKGAVTAQPPNNAPVAVASPARAPSSTTAPTTLSPLGATTTPVKTPLPVSPPSAPLPSIIGPVAGSSQPGRTPAIAPPTPPAPAVVPSAPLATLPGSTLPRSPIPAPVLSSRPPSSATAKWTNFEPAINGFRFYNSFNNSFIGPPINYTTTGLCGGMTYAVLDYFYAGLTIPNQEFRPANGTPIQAYLYTRQVTTLLPNLDKWAELIVNPFGQRTAEFFNWGINERLKELASFIDRGVPVPLGLHGFDGFTGGDHQVLAIGYDLGRYKGDLGSYKEDVKVYILDPNFPNRTMTLVPSPGTSDYYYLEETTERWRTYFVDGKYVKQAPPDIPNITYANDGAVHELRLLFSTGWDDMRGGADHVDLTIQLTNNTSQYYPNISLGGRWLPQVSEMVQVILTQPVSPAMIQTIVISTNATGGLNGDNWDMDRMQVTAIGGGFKRDLLTTPAGPYRFTGAQTPLAVAVK